MALVTGLERVEAFRGNFGGCLALGVRRGFTPPSWVFVAIVEALDEASEPASKGTEDCSSGPSTWFRLRFLIIWFETVAAFNPPMANDTCENVALSPGCKAAIG